MSQPENWTSRCKCGACGAIVWIDRAAPVRCLCGGSSINADGTFSGNAMTTNDREMIAFASNDSRLVIKPKYVG